MIKEVLYYTKHIVTRFALSRIILCNKIIQKVLNMCLLRKKKSVNLQQKTQVFSFSLGFAGVFPI